MKPRVLIAGGNGMLAADLLAVFSESAEAMAVGHKGLDITDAGSIEAALRLHRPDVLLNAAAYTAVDAAETDRETAEAVNARGPELLAKACRQSGVRLVHFGTDQVFDGEGTEPRTEDEVPRPLNHYAASKWRGDQAVLEHGEGALVLRVQWLYGARKDRFSPLRKQAVFTPFSDQFGAPTWTREIARVVRTLIDKQAKGLFHFAYDDYASWAEVFEFVKQTWNLSVELKPRPTREVVLPAQRPLFSVLSNRKLTTALGKPLGSWKTPLSEFLAQRAEVS